MQGFDEVYLKIFKEAMPSLPSATPNRIFKSGSRICGCDQIGGWKEEGFGLVHQSLR